MIGSTGAAGSSIASVYAATSRSLADALTRIASGKKFQNASEDMLGFIRAQNLQVDISGYEEVRQNLTEFKTYTSAAVDAASIIYEKLTDMKELAVQYVAAGVALDTDAQAEYESDFDALRTEVSSMLTNTRVDGINVTTFGSDLKTVNLDPDGTGSLDLNFTTNTTSLLVTGLDLSTGDDDADVQTEIDKVLSYMSQAKAFDGIVEQQLKLTGNIINSKQAVMSLITDIDDAAEMNKVLDLSIRQQAVMSMMAQGNIVQNSLLKLYE